MNKIEIKPLKTELLGAVNKLLKDNNTEISKKMENVVKKAIKRIVKKSKKQKKNSPKDN